MKKIYKEATIEIIDLDKKEILTQSGGTEPFEPIELGWYKNSPLPEILRQRRAAYDLKRLDLKNNSNFTMLKSY